MSVSAVQAKTSTGHSNLPSTPEDMEEALIEAQGLWWRSPGEGAWPFAGDGPWHLAQGEVGDVSGDYSMTLIETDAGQLLEVRKIDSRRPRTPLRSREVERRDQVTEWLQMVPDPMDRRLLWLATLQLWRGECRIPWKAICGWLGYQRTTTALAWRYRMAMAMLVCSINGWPVRRARELAVSYASPHQREVDEQGIRAARW